MGTATSARFLYDMHCHLGFSSNLLQAARCIHQADAGAFAVCVEPFEYERVQTLLVDFPRVRVGVGLHPWWLSEDRVGPEEVTRACELVTHNRFVGEVGLDFGARHADTAQVQLEAFERIMRSCADAGERIVSLHAVRSASRVLDVLQDTGAAQRCTCIFHWYSDTPEQLQRAVRMGCLFSVGSASLGTRKGREYVRQIPASQLLLETDCPAQGQPYDVDAMQQELVHTLVQAEKIKGCSLAEQICATSMRVLNL